jgi:hypothetical protein
MKGANATVTRPSRMKIQPDQVSLESISRLTPRRETSSTVHVSHPVRDESGEGARQGAHAVENGNAPLHLFAGVPYRGDEDGGWLMPVSGGPLEQQSRLTKNPASATPRKTRAL